MLLIVSGQLSHGLGLVGVAPLLGQFLQDLGGGQCSRRAVQALDTNLPITHERTRGREGGIIFCPLGHLLPGNLRQLFVVLNDGPQEKVSARVPLSFSRLLLPQCSLGICLTFSQLGKCVTVILKWHPLSSLKWRELFSKKNSNSTKCCSCR